MSYSIHCITIILICTTTTTTTTTTATTTNTTTYYFLPTTLLPYYPTTLLPTTYYSLGAASLRPRNYAYHLLPTTYCLLPTAGAAAAEELHPAVGRPLRLVAARGARGLSQDRAAPRHVESKPDVAGRRGPSA